MAWRGAVGTTSHSRESPENLTLMREIDRLYIKRPFFGTRKVREAFGIDRKRAQRLVRLMGLEAVRPKRSTSCPAPGQKVYPLFAAGFGDHAARPGLGERHQLHPAAARLPLSDGGHGSLQPQLPVTKALRYADTALLRGSPRCSAVAGTAQDFQHRSGGPVHGDAFTSRLEKRGVAISMDGRGRARPFEWVSRATAQWRYTSNRAPDCPTIGVHLKECLIS